MRKVLSSLSCLVGASVAGAAFAEEFSLGGSIDLGAEWGLGKKAGNGFTYQDAFAKFNFTLSLADTTDRGVQFGGTVNLAGETSLAFSPYVSTSDLAGDRYHWVYRVTGRDYSDVKARVHNVSGGQRIDTDKIVGVKVNSSWVSVGGTHTEYDMNLDIDWDNKNDQHKANICKLATKVRNVTTNGLTPYIARATANGVISLVANLGTTITPKTGVPLSSTFSGLLPAGQFINNSKGFTGTVVRFATNIGLNSGTIRLLGHGHRSTNAKPTLFTFNHLTIRSFVGGTDGQNVATVASVFAGPFAEVKLQSSTTKLVNGLVCIVQETDTNTKYYQRPVDAVIQASDATIFVEGGFGRLTVQTEDYDGEVVKIGEAADQAELESSGAIAIASANLAGIGQAYAALDLLGPVNNDLSILAGVTVDLDALSFSIETVRTKDDKWLKNWDAGLSYETDYALFGLIADSTNAFGLYTELDLLGFEVEADMVWAGYDAHQKTGLKANLGANVDINRVNLSGSVNEAFDLDVGANFLLEGARASFELYGSYAFAEDVGKMGVKLSF